MSDQNPQEEVRLERAPEIDDGTLLRIRQIRPVEKAASPIIDHNLELIDLAAGLKKWYQGKGVSTPHDLLGDLLDPNERDFEIVFRKLPPEPATKEDVKALVEDARHRGLRDRHPRDRDHHLDLAVGDLRRRRHQRRHPGHPPNPSISQSVNTHQGWMAPVTWSAMDFMPAMEGWPFCLAMETRSMQGTE